MANRCLSQLSPRKSKWEKIESVVAFFSFILHPTKVDRVAVTHSRERKMERVFVYLMQDTVLLILCKWLSDCPSFLSLLSLSFSVYGAKERECSKREKSQLFIQPFGESWPSYEKWFDSGMCHQPVCGPSSLSEYGHEYNCSERDKSRTTAKLFYVASLICTLRMPVLYLVQFFVQNQIKLINIQFEINCKSFICARFNKHIKPVWT